MAIISDYPTLRSNILEYIKRTDALSHIDNFIALAESDIWDVLRVREMEARATASTVVDSRYIALPSRFIKMRSLRIYINEVQLDLDAVTPKDLAVYTGSGVPTKYTIASQIEMNQNADQVYSLEMQYLQELLSLTESNPENDIITNYPMIYLAGALSHAYQWSLQEDRAQYWRSVFEKQVARANRKTRSGKYGPAPAKTIIGRTP